MGDKSSYTLFFTTALANGLTTKLNNARESALSPTSEFFYRCPLFEKKLLRGHVRIVIGNMRVKFEVRSFNRFKLVWLTGPLRTDTENRHTSKENSISAIHFVHLAEIIMKVPTNQMAVIRNSSALNQTSSEAARSQTRPDPVYCVSRIVCLPGFVGIKIFCLVGTEATGDKKLAQGFSISGQRNSTPPPTSLVTTGP